MKSVILYFTDLEGTILREKDGKYDPGELQIFLQQLSDLQENLDAKVKINIVSPVFMEHMKRIVNRFNIEIAKFNRTNRKTDLDLINAAMASLDSNQYFEQDYTYDVIEPFPHIDLDGGEHGKSQHVNNWIRAIPNAKLYIYAGNGRNDILAMKKVLEQPNGIVICPKNSRTEVKNIATVVSDKEDLEGIINNLKLVNKSLKKTHEDHDDDERE